MNKLNREQIGFLKKKIQNADAIVIGAGAGLSTSAGFDKRRLFYTQGDYGLFQSVNPDMQKTYIRSGDLLLKIQMLYTPA